MEQPDKFTGEWYRVQFAGLCHTVNAQAAEIARLEASRAKLFERVEQLEAASIERDAAVGAMRCEVHDLKRELAGHIELIEGRMQAQRDWIKAQTGAKT